jgi:hypothetical protein
MVDTSDLLLSVEYIGRIDVLLKLTLFALYDMMKNCNYQITEKGL